MEKKRYVLVDVDGQLDAWFMSLVRAKLFAEEYCCDEGDRYVILDVEKGEIIERWNYE